MYGKKKFTNLKDSIKNLFEKLSENDIFKDIINNPFFPVETDQLALIYCLNLGFDEKMCQLILNEIVKKLK